MALSIGNRRRSQTSLTWAAQKQSSLSYSHIINQQGPNCPMRKQNSFIDAGHVNSNCERSYLSRGLSVDRFQGLSFRQRLIVPAGQYQKRYQFQKYTSTDPESKIITISKPNGNSRNSKSCSATQDNINTGKIVSDTGRIKVKIKEKNFTAWSSSSCLLNSLDNDRKKPINLSGNELNNNDDTKTTSSIRGEVNKINLNIVLSQTIKATTEAEVAQSDIDSSSEGADSVPSGPLNILESNNTQLAIASAVAQRRAQFQSSRNNTTNYTTTPSTVSSAQHCNFSASPSLTVQRRPPLVRAMSAPVRTIDDSKGHTAATKRKSRRRKLVSHAESKLNENKAINLVLNNSFNGGKKVLARARSMVAPDVVTLVSLISSEGSDSEREDNSAATVSDNPSPARGAPLLRKTGKSVSFQENYPPNFQLRTKEYTQMFRRGSVVARIWTNRPPTAPDMSIHVNDSNCINTMASGANNDCTTSYSSENNEKILNETIEETKGTTSNEYSPSEYVFPQYVHSIKERECWKLYQKMSEKGINVTYDTILRGMLTPTEFRQLQKQREIEEAKTRELEDAASEKEIVKPSAVERLSKVLLQK